ncbi:chemotaxis protein CheW [Candidatus Omnitrophota bacterium]
MSKEDQELLNEKKLAREGKYLTFALGHEDYGIEILKVMEIIKIMDVTSIPKAPDYVIGIINLRGKVIPVISIRQKFNMPEEEYTSETCIVVVNLKNVLVGIVIDKVNEVVDISADAIEDPPSFGSSNYDGTILGIGKIDDTVKILLNIDKILDEDLSLIGEVSS